jgi:hypothetical protein
VTHSGSAVYEVVARYAQTRQGTNKTRAEELVARALTAAAGQGSIDRSELDELTELFEALHHQGHLSRLKVFYEYGDAQGRLVDLGDHHERHVHTDPLSWLVRVPWKCKDVLQSWRWPLPELARREAEAAAS